MSVALQKLAPVARRLEIAPTFMNRSEASWYLGLSLSTLDRLIRSGRLPAIKIGEHPTRHSVVIKIADLDRLLTPAPAPSAPQGEV